jgi:hypothetical protein
VPAAWKLGSLQLIVGYYLATPLFWLADYLTGASLRASALEGRPLLKAAYYGMCCLMGLVMLLRPRAISLLSLTETSFNLLLLVVGLLGPYYRALDQLATDGSLAAPPITSSAVVNFVLAGGILLLSFYQNKLVRR